MQQKPSAIWCALASNTAIKSPKDLDGKTFATFGSNESDAVVRRMIQTDGGKGEFDKVTVGTSTFQTMESGKADFGGFYATWEGVQADMYGPKLNCFTEPDYGVPGNADTIGIITNNEIIVSVCYHQTDMIPDFIEHTRRKGIEVRNKLDLIFRLIYSSAVWFLKYLKQINIDITAAEKELERSIRNEDLLRLMKLQKTLVYFNTSIRGNEVMIGKLKTIFQDTDYLDEELVEDVIIELKQAFNTVNIYSDILTGTMDAFASIISNNVNAIMKRMTSLSITLMIPTLIASFYGMNVDIHLEEMPHAFLLIILVSVFLSALSFVIFRKIKWF